MQGATGHHHSARPLPVKRSLAMPNEANNVKIALIDRLLCLVLAISFLAFTSPDFYSHFPFDFRIIAVGALMEIIVCLALLRIGGGAIVRDLIDLSLYSLLFRIITLLANFFNHELYALIAGGGSKIINNGLFLASSARLMWGYPKNGNFAPLEWPIIGLYGLEWKRRHGDNAASAAAYFRVLATLIISMEIAAILLPLGQEIYQYIPSVVGLIVVFLYAKPIRQEVVETERDLADQADLLEKYEDIIQQVAHQVKEDGNADPTTGRDVTGPTTEKSKLRLVKDEQDEP